MRSYPPPSSSASVIAKQTPTQTLTGIDGTSRCSTCDTPPYMPPTCRSVSVDRNRPAPRPASSRRRGAGHAIEAFEAGMAGRDRVAPKLRLHDRLDRATDEDDPEHGEPTCAPSVVVAISSPDPTIEAASTMPGPMRPNAVASETGGASMPVAQAHRDRGEVTRSQAERSYMGQVVESVLAGMQDRLLISWPPVSVVGHRRIRAHMSCLSKRPDSGRAIVAGC